LATKEILYSTNTALSYKIAKKYYRNEHFVWCTFRFNPRSTLGILEENPQSSDPYYRYRQLSCEISGPDGHGALIRETKAGLKKGAEIKYSTGIINELQRNEILTIVEKASLQEFKPLLYAIPYSKVKHILKEVPIGDRASPTSDEYIIESLSEDCFDILDLGELK
jgi:hypothetical protein